MTSAAEFAEFARRHLPQPWAGRWISLLRPGVEFPWTDDGAESSAPVALRGGGEPLLPDGVDWPMFEGCLPMRFIAELDCAAVAAAGGVDLMPASGHLLFFCVDYWSDAEDLDEDWWNRVTPWTGGKVIYLPDGVTRRPRPTPPELAELDPLEIDHRPAQAVSTPPNTDDVWAERYFGPEARAIIDKRVAYFMRYHKMPDSDEYPLWATEFSLGIHERRCFVQSGGHPYAIQGPPRIEAARDALRRAGITDPDGDALLDEAERWRLLLQEGVEEAGVVIGYWLIRDDDLAAGRFDRVHFDMQH